MKKLIFLLVALLTISCNSQIRSNYTITFDQHPQAAKYLVFIEQRTQSTGFALQDSVDYLEPIDLSYLKIAETTTATPVTISLVNDGKYLRAGLVIEDSAGFYSVMGVSQVFQKGTIPNKPTNIAIIKQ